METAIGIFDSRDRAEKALTELLKKEVPKESIIFLTTSETDATSLAKEFGAWAGGLVGGTAGMTAGVMGATLLLIPGIGTAVAIGIGATTLLGLAGAGAGAAAAKAVATDKLVPQPLPNNEDAALFAKVLKDGKSLIIVRTEFHDVLAAACEILDRTGIAIQERSSSRTQAKTRHVGHVSIVEVSGRIALGEGNVMLREVVEGLVAEGKRNIVLNVAGVEFLDSAGIGELVRLHASLRRAGGQLKLSNTGSKVKDLLVMTRLNSVFDIQQDEATAIQSFTAAT